MTTATTRACPKCNSAVAAETKFCPNCGAAVSGVFSGGGTPQDGTAQLGVDQVDTLYPILADATLGDYDIYGELGRGGMAAVYLALDLSLNRKVAIKTKLPDLIGKTGMVDRFKREAQTAAALSHPHIIQIFSVKQTKNLVYFVMKYIEGRSLESVIIERGKLDVDLTRVILSQVGSALAFAHRKGVVHRDMKPANIMLEEDGWAIVTDFGIAKVQEAQNLTATGTAIGTPHYMSPEQFHNKAVTGASDQYSLGIVAYEMLTGKKPFDGGTYAEIITQHLFEPPPDLRMVRPDIPQNVAEAVMKMMAKEASARFPDLDAAVAAMGTPTTTQGEKARTQIISIAKSGPDRKVRMSVPQSPVPAQRKSPAPTVVESAPAKSPAPKRPAAPPRVEKRESPTLLIVCALLILMGGGGFLGWYKFIRTAAKPADALATQTGQPSSTPAATPNADSIQLAMADSIRKVVQDSITRADSIAKAEAAAAAAKRLAANTKPPANKTTGAGAGTKSTSSTARTQTPASQSETKTQPAPQTEAPKPPAPVVPLEVSIRIGSSTPGAALYANKQLVGVVSAVAWIKLKPVDGRLELQIRADCAQTSWDTILVIPAGRDTLTVGRRNLKC
jgi:serine/threonine-protein kinase